VRDPIRTATGAPLPAERFDLAMVGTGPAGHYGAIQAAKLGKRVVAIERERHFYGMHYNVKADLTVEDVTASTRQIIQHEVAVLEAQRRRNGVEIRRGEARFAGPHHLEIRGEDGSGFVEADRILLAPGSRPAAPPGIAFDGERVIDSNQILHLTDLPKRLIVVGAGVIGAEYACIFSALGVAVTLTDARESFLEFVDSELVDYLRFHMRRQNVELLLGEEVASIERHGDVVVARTKSNKSLAGDCLLYSVGRQGNTDALRLERAGLEADPQGRLKVDEGYRTAVPHISAAGDVIGFPALASSSREQGRQAVCRAFGVECHEPTSGLPFGIYTIPEISMVGPTEQELTAAGVPYGVDGVLKLLFHLDTLEILAVHGIGEGATEIIHIGQAVRAFGGTLEYLADTVFNYPTLAECYKVAALEGINRARMLRQFANAEDEQGDREAA
jgi:NAD(P) transhydrogenase